MPETIQQQQLKQKEKTMLFHITQTHSAELCPKDEGGSKVLYNPKAEGVKLVAMYGRFPSTSSITLSRRRRLRRLKNF